MSEGVVYTNNNALLVCIILFHPTSYLTYPILCGTGETAWRDDRKEMTNTTTHVLRLSG